MVKVFINTEEEYYMDGYLKQNLDKAKDVVKDDWDMIFLIDGYEGVGKSVFTQQLAKYCDPNFSIDKITFNAKDFKTAVRKADNYSAIIYDEAYGGLSSKSWMNKVNQSIVEMLTEIRYKNLFIFIVLPTFFDLVRYVALWRSRALIHVYDVDFARGYLAFYNKDRKKQLYIKGKKFYSYSTNIIKPNFIGRFTNHYTVNKDDYVNRKKLNAERVEKQQERVDKLLERDKIIIRMKELGYKFDEIGKVSDLTKARISQIVNERENDSIA